MVVRRFVVSLSRPICRASHHRRRDQSNTQQNRRGRFGYRRSRRADAHRSDCGVERLVVLTSGEIVGTDAAEIDESRIGRYERRHVLIWDRLGSTRV
jgi:hypothetical protein